ncbi:hypothetical protein F4V43_00180 [Paenibacillus spiritus]|uniref:Uncharacterized protein n=1 Tax=Paenibacillus spiritus TaxID=2496557 RepID=A0A5J5GK17_9BACL|nr:hypothetical protein [Paenibacillus spiritus]KAA9008589.1 hypothetical protein F4V43_00180 [Paenibacillus spiritus]
MGTLILGILSYVTYAGYNYVPLYYKQEHIKGVIIQLTDNIPGAGNGSISQSITSTAPKEIAEVVRVLKKRTLIKTFSDMASPKIYTQKFSEVKIELISDTGLTLEYRINSLKEVKIKKGFSNKASNVIVLDGSRKKWFNELVALFEEKKQNRLWIYKK